MRVLRRLGAPLAVYLISTIRLCFGGEPFAEFSDRFFREHLGPSRIPGAVVNVVRDGRIVFSKGYGVANIDLRTPMSPAETVLRVASSSKLLTATAVMQQVERGKLSLDADVNTYLRSFRLEDNFPRPVRLRDLMTHSAGFEERFIGLESRSPERFLSLEEYLRTRMPARIYPPGEVTSYSNHGFALAGYLVQVVSGQPFAAYMKDHVLEPLEMSHSSFEIDSPLRSALATGYVWNDGRFSAEPMDYIETVPASSLLATAEDMSHFMIAQLGQGEYSGKPVLSRDSVRLMQTRQFSNHPELPGFGFGFFEWYRNGVRALTHGGEARGFNTLLCIFPEKNVGFFLSYNRFGSDAAVEYFNEFVDRFFPAGRAEPPGPAQPPGPGLAEPRRTLASASEPSRISGIFRMNRYPRSDFTKISSLIAGFAQELTVRTTEAGELEVHGLPWAGEADSVWRPIGRGVFQNPATGEKLAFRTDASGAITHLFRGSKPEGAFDPIPWYESTTLHLWVLAVACLVFALNLFALRAQWHFALPGLAYLGFGASAGLLFHLIPPVEIVYGVPAPVRAWLWIPSLCGVWLALCLVALAWRWRKTRDRPLVALQLGAGLSVEAILMYWHFF